MQVHEELQKLTKEDLVAFYASRMVTSGSSRRQFIISSTSQKHESVFETTDGYYLIDDIREQQSGLQVLLPDCNSSVLVVQSDDV